MALSPRVATGIAPMLPQPPPAGDPESGMAFSLPNGGAGRRATRILDAAAPARRYWGATKRPCARLRSRRAGTWEKRDDGPDRRATTNSPRPDDRVLCRRDNGPGP